MATCTLHGGKFSESAVCPKCLGCKHESAWRIITSKPVEVQPIPEDSINAERALQYAIKQQVASERQRIESNSEAVWKCNGCYKRFDDSYGGKKTVLYDGVWCDADSLKSCAVCSVLFVADRSDAKYCSSTCRVKSHRSL